MARKTARTRYGDWRARDRMLENWNLEKMQVGIWICSKTIKIVKMTSRARRVKKRKRLKMSPCRSQPHNGPFVPKRGSGFN